METKQLITFVTLAKERSYQRASEILNYAPSTLAKQIRVLEEELNVKLTERRGTRIELTKDGRKFLPHAEQMLKDYDEMIHDLDPEQGKSIRVAGGEPLVGYSFSDMLLDFFKVNADVRATVEMICCSEIPEMIARDETDIGFVHDMNILKPEGMQVVPFYREEVCLVTTPKNPLAGKPSVNYGDLNGKDFVYTYGECSFCAEFIARMKKNGVESRSSLFLGSYMSVLNGVRCDDRITLIPATSLPRVLQDGFVRLNW
ncbi:MAG: LysR family transcriptional regulator, partial [Christensenellales bacterium]